MAPISLPNSRDEWIVGIGSSAVVAMLTAVFTWLGGQPFGKVLVAAVAVFAAVLVLSWIWGPYRHRREILGILSSVVGAFDYHEGYLEKGVQAGNPAYVGQWPEGHRVLEKDPAFQVEKRASERGFQALARLQEGHETPETALEVIKESRGVVLAGLSRLGVRTGG
jgi:hypothetical protein